MKRTPWRSMARTALLVAFVAASSLSQAQSPPPTGVTQVAVESDDDDMMMTWLGIALRDYANAMANWLLDASRESGKPLTLRALERFQTQLRRATFAYFEYSYEVNGVRHSRIYLAASGRSFATYISPFAGGLVAPAKQDADYFMSDDVVRHSMAGEGQDSNVTPLPHRPPLPNRGNDAEIKALQSIIRDVDAGVVRPYGNLIGFVSKQPCDSCSAAMRRFAEETHSEVHVNYVHGANEDGLRTPAWTALRMAREALIADLATMLTQPVAEAPVTPAQPEPDDTPSPSVCRRS